MTLQQLECFCATARLGSLSAAARELRLSQPSVSDHVRRLQAELGAELMFSNGRGMQLTAEGRTFLVHAEGVLAGAEAASAAVGSGSRGRRRTLSLGLPRNAPYYPIVDLVADLLSLQPDLEVRLPGLNSSLVADAVRGGDLEAALVVLPVNPDGLDIRALFKDEVLFASADPRRTRAPAKIQLLAEGRLILGCASVGFNDPTRRQLAARAQRAGIALGPRIDVEHMETVLELTARGYGDTIVPRCVSRHRIFPSILTTVGFAEPLYDVFALITREGATLANLRPLLAAVEAWAGELPDRIEIEPVIEPATLAVTS